jgi:2,4-dienoyl-CoA reductase-like NADH-dependent reductase (Old Yellow Enzyme family)
VLHGAAAVIIEATAVTPNGRISQYDSGIWLDSHIEPIHRIVKLAHSQNALVGIQLAHAGRKASTPPPFFQERGGREQTYTPDSELGWTDDVVGASPVPFSDNWIVPKELSKDQIKEIIQAFVDATKRALKANVDFIELHGGMYIVQNSSINI